MSDDGHAEIEVTTTVRIPRSTLCDIARLVVDELRAERNKHDRDNVVPLRRDDDQAASS